MQGKEPLSVGHDRVVPQDDGSLLVYSREPKDEAWRTRKFRKTKILFKEHAYFISEIRDGGEKCDLIYVLRLWPADESDTPGAVVEYDAPYINALREKSKHIQRIERPMGLAILLLSPLLGLAWAPAKRLWEEKYGVAIRRATLNSIYVFGGCAWLVVSYQGLAFTIGGISRSGLPPMLPWSLFGAAVVVGMDSLARYRAGVLEASSPRYYGFLEYIFHPHYA